MADYLRILEMRFWTAVALFSAARLDQLVARERQWRSGL